jgi:methionyl-tRNA formyltransferase
MSLSAPLRVYFITEDDPLYVAEFFEAFLSLCEREEIQIVGISIQRPFNEARLSSAQRVLALYGPSGFARLFVRFARRKLQGRSIARLARDENILLVPTKSVNDSSFVERVKLLDPDLIVSVAAPEIFKDAILKAPRLGCINVHSGRLPKYRGMMPTFWQMRSGEPHVTVTVHEMAEKLDAGAVLGTAECPIQERDSLDRVMVAAKHEGAQLLIRVLRELAAGEAQPQALDMAEASYFSFPQRQDVLKLRQLGHRLI